MVELKGFTTPDCKMFCFSYEHDGSWWCLNIPCYDQADAMARARLLNLRYDGELGGSCPANEDGTPDLAKFVWEPGHGPDEMDPAEVLANPKAEWRAGEVVEAEPVLDTEWEN